MAKKKTVLIVDDDQFALLLIERLLVDAKYKVLKSADGKEALEIAQKEVPDIIIMDIMMPGLDGIAAVLKLRSEPTTKSIPIIVCTSVKENEDEMIAKNLGVVDYVRKSPDMKDLVEKIEKALVSSSTD